MINLYNQDCLVAMQQIKDESIDLIVTSPPYYNARQYSQYNSLDEYLSTMKQIFQNCFHKLKESRILAVNISCVIVPREKRSTQSYRLPLPFYFTNFLLDIGFEFLEDIIWVKPNGSVPNRNGGFFRHRKPLAYKPNCITEYILIFKKPSLKLIDKFLKNDEKSLVLGEYEKTNVWHMNPTKNKIHDATFPINLSNKIIRYYSYIGDTVLDPFSGLATTGISCLHLERNFIGIEKNTEYYEASKNRIKEHQLKKGE